MDTAPLRQGGLPPDDGLGRFDRQARFWPLLVVLVVLVLFVPVLGERPFRFEEGRRFAQAIAILHGGSWWRLETFGIPYVNKPPMLPWLIVLGSKLFGAADEFAARLPGLLAMTGSALIAGLLAARIEVRQAATAALYAAIFYLASHTVFFRAMLSETDATASFFASSAFLVWALARMRGPVGAPAWAAVTLFFAAALLTKGPVPLIFPLLPMVLIPLRERRYRELGALFICLAASFVPLGLWLYLNADAATVGRMSAELRLRGSSSFADYLRDEPRIFGEAILTSMPVLATGAAWIWLNRSWRKTQAGWLDHALFLYAIPASLFVLLWPHSAGRYVMPAAWPLAVLSGLWGARFWPVRAVRAGFGIAFAIYAAIQIGFAVQAGRTPDQMAQRREASVLRQTFAALPQGRVLLVARQRNNFNRFVYTERPLDLIDPDRLACPPDAPFLLIEDRYLAGLDPAAWSKHADIGGTKLSLYRRAPNAPACADPAKPPAPPD